MIHLFTNCMYVNDMYSSLDITCDRHSHILAARDISNIKDSIKHNYWVVTCTKDKSNYTVMI